MEAGESTLTSVEPDVQQDCKFCRRLNMGNLSEN